VTSSDALRAIWVQNRDEVLAQVGVVEDAVAAALAGALVDDERARAARAAHKLAGSVGTLGFMAASERARTLELALAGPPSPVVDLPRLAEAVLALRSELEGDGPGAPHPGDAEAAEDGPGGGDPSPPSEGPLALLIVDKDPARGSALLAEARARGVRTMLAAGPSAARRALREERPEVVVLDLAAATGPRAALELLDEVGRERPVIVVTDPHEPVDRVEVARHGGRGFLPRSLSPRQTVDAVVALRERERVRVRGTRVLAVDDDPTVLAALDVVLREAGLNVSPCSDPGRFWEHLEEEEPDLVVLDFDMPGVTGVELCRALRNEPRWAALPVVFLTSRADADSVRAVFDAGADDYVTKPFVGPEVVARILNRLERVRLFLALAETDQLTGLANRARSVELLESYLRLANRTGQPLCVAVLDVDRFKQINDRHGHAMGDAVLQGLGAAIRRTFRGEDVGARWGGDELVIGLYGMADGDGRERLGRFLEDIRALRFGARGEVAVTLSAGLAQYPRDGDGVDDLYRAADRALYAAKAEGRDRVLVHDRDAGASGRTVDVAIVEDDAVLGALLEHALQTRGYRTRWITDGVAAATELAATTPELTAPLLLLDWDLPGLDGLRVLGRLRERGVLARTRVIMLTARGGEAEVLEALEAGAVDHVTKPFSVPVLMQRVRRALEPG
jgi:diguanylate cyclase (GGDEF)-like protein